MATIHLIIVIATGLLVLYSDEQAAAWVLGKKSTLPAARIAFLHKAITIGLTLLLLTGGYLYLRGVEAYLTLTPFVVKMVAVAALIINTWAIDRLGHVATVREFASLSHRERVPLFISGAVSFAGWVTAIICGLIIA